MLKQIASMAGITLAIAALTSPAFAANTKKKTKKVTTEEVVPAPVPHHVAKSFERPYGLAGCGLGSVWFNKHESQVLASTTNGCSGTQTFGITTGTLNCVDGPNEQVAKRMDKFVEVNKVAMASDISRGSGETVHTLASMLGCPDANSLGKAMQSQFAKIFTNENVSTTEVTDSVITVVIQDPSLSQSCTHVSMN